MSVHLEGSLKQLLETLETHRQRYGQTDRAPERIPAADPVPELEHVGRVDAELFHFRRIGGQRHEMPRHILVPGSGSEEPILGRMGVGHRLLRGESLGGDDEQRSLGVQSPQRFHDVRPVHIGDKMHVEPRTVVFQGFTHHVGSQIRPPDADIDHIGDLPSGIAFPLSIDDLPGKVLHLPQYAVHVGHHVVAVDIHRSIGPVAQGGVQHRTVFRLVDLIAGKHLFDGIAHFRLAGQVVEQAHRLVGDQVFGKIHQEIASLEMVLVEAVRIGGEEFREGSIVQFVDVGLEFLPGAGGRRMDGFQRHKVSSVCIMALKIA